MLMSENTLLLTSGESSRNIGGLSLAFTVICILDVFGVFPIITLSKAVIDCGININKRFYGILIILAVCSAQIYTAILLGKCWIIAEKIYPTLYRRNRYPYSALAEITYGRCLSNCVIFLLDLTIFGGGIPNLIVASRNLQLLNLRINDNNTDISYCYWIIILGLILCPVLWLGSPKDMKCVCTLSVLIVVAVFLLTSGSLLFTNKIDSNLKEANDGHVPLWKSILTAYGIIAFQFDIHPTILTIQIDMHNKFKLPIAIIGAFIVSLCMFGIVAALTCFKYGKGAHPSILETMPPTIILDVVAGLTALQLCLTSAVSNNALYQHMEDCLGISREFNSKRCILRTILTLLSIIIAESVPKFDLVMSIIGGTLTGPLVFVLPPLFYLKMLSINAKYEKQLKMQTFNNDDNHLKIQTTIRDCRFNYGICNGWKYTFRAYFEKGLCGLIIIVGAAATILTTYLNISNFILSYSDFTNTKPCIYNISATLLYL
ncbi:hypothetical protein NQ315_004847 [Exocentrus adspersus]|uniref:Amino acid transporter transmembrane domain-containing protein n=1 Tax=Exocentrus adspersus TaxID=1586481 RepID=A0AAV8W224_9CUCU|nr:hypothetical protein NQ315_004847 [Exocentrus adspersus]